MTTPPTSASRALDACLQSLRDKVRQLEHDKWTLHRETLQVQAAHVQLLRRAATALGSSPTPRQQALTKELVLAQRHTADLQAKVEALEADVEALQLQRTSDRDKVEQAQQKSLHAAAEADRSEQRRRALEQRINALLARTDDLQRAQPTAPTTAPSVDQLAAHLEDKLAELEDLRSSRRRLEHDLAAAEAKIRAAKHRQAELVAALHSARRDVRDGSDDAWRGRVLVKMASASMDAAASSSVPPAKALVAPPPQDGAPTSGSSLTSSSAVERNKRTAKRRPAVESRRPLRNPPMRFGKPQPSGSSASSRAARRARVV